MRIRSIKPEFWRSDDVNEMPIEDRLLFIGLWSYVDDNGVGIDRHADICADLFAHDLSVSPHDTLMRVHDGLNRLAKLGVIRRYKVGKKAYLEIVSWEKHQRINRPSPGRYPRSDDANAEVQEPLTDDSLNTHEGSLPGAGEQGSRGAGEQSSSSKPQSDPEREEITQLLDLLDKLIGDNGNRPPKRNKTNTAAMRLLVDRDGYTVEQVEWIIRWCQADQFWHTNILSASKLRDQFPQLVAKAKGEEKKKNGQGPGMSEEEALDRKLYPYKYGG